MGRWIFVFAALTVGCPNARQEQPSSNHAASPSVPSPPSPPPSETVAPRGSKLPPLDTVKTLVVRSKQGGAFHPKCGGVISELTIDLTNATWTRGLCTDDSQGASPNPNRPLDRRSGKLTADHRTLLETEYAKLIHVPGPSCGTDVGRIELTLSGASGPVTFFVNRGTSCGDTPPEVAEDLGEFHARIGAIARQP